MIRKAKISDIDIIHGILVRFAEKDMLIPRSRSELYDQLRDFSVYEDEGGGFAGCVALHITWKDLAEIRSLAVIEEQQGRGIGRKLVESALSEAVNLGISRVFTLTNQSEFFEKLGFKEVDKSMLPHKVWSDCLKCTKFPDCDEIAYLMEL